MGTTNRPEPPRRNGPSARMILRRSIVSRRHVDDHAFIVVRARIGVVALAALETPHEPVLRSARALISSRRAMKPAMILEHPLVVSPEHVDWSNHEPNCSSFDRLRTSESAESSNRTRPHPLRLNAQQ